MAREARDDESNVEEVLLVMPIQVSCLELSQQQSIKDNSQLDFDAVSDEGSLGYDSDQKRPEPALVPKKIGNCLGHHFDKGIVFFFKLAIVLLRITYRVRTLCIS
ncbi:unnamed protein product [Cuscuta epithymum]|uniref:Uncharacterized protein n=1 Tax=Cuscuta epithymum TaxID=186058 RepID=A0AAV0DZE3_9ASTE|nr:unnamed protein product [Cuscuta epithymum]